MNLSRLRRWWIRRSATPWKRTGEVRYRLHGEHQRPLFQALGYNKARPFFPHRGYVLPKAAPDAVTVDDVARAVFFSASV